MGLPIFVIEIKRSHLENQHLVGKINGIFNGYKLELMSSLVYFSENDPVELKLFLETNKIPYYFRVSQKGNKKLDAYLVGKSE